MPQELRLLLTLEHLPAHDVVDSAGNSTMWTLGMVISAAAWPDPFTAPQRDLLRPWIWNLTRDVFFRVEVGTTAGPVSTTPLDAVSYAGQPMLDPSGVLTPFFHNLRDHAVVPLNQELELIELPGVPDPDLTKGDPANVVWNPESGRRVNARIQSGVGTDTGRPSRPWHTLLGQASRYASPIPQALNISHNFRIPVVATTPGDVVRVFAAPGIGVSAGFPAATQPRDTGPAPWNLGAFRWEYDQPAMDSILVVAHFMPARIRPTTAGVQTTYFDLNTLYVNKPEGEAGSDEEDWRPMLEQRMADALDVGARVIEAARERLGPDGNVVRAAPRPTHANRIAFEQLVLASLRDIAGIGYRAAPGGRSLINMALATYSAQEDSKPLVEPLETPAAEAPIRTAIERRVEAAFGNLTDWKKFLRDTLPELSDARVLGEHAQDPPVDPVAEDPVAFERSMAELEHVRMTVLNAANLERLIRAQWQRIAGDTAILGRLARLATRADFPVLDLRSLLAKENLWAFWRDFTPLIRSTPTDPSGRAAVRDNFPLLFLTYFRKRFNPDLTPTAECTTASLNLPNYSEQHPQFRDLPPNVITAVADAVCEEIEFFSTRAAEQLVAGRRLSTQATTNGEVEPTDVPHAITLQVDSLGDLPADTDNPDTDLLDHISGIAVLMREKPAPPGNGTGWKCLNVAAPQFRVQSDPPDDQPPIIQPPEPLLTFVPLRIGYQNDLRQGSVTYNNHPIIAESPIGDLSVFKLEAPERDQLRSPVATNKQRDKTQPIVKYVIPPTVSGTPPRRFLPGLKFGSTYEVLPFLITNSGAMPRAIAPDRPYDPNLDAFNTTTPAVRALVRNKIREVKYLRKVRVGEVRMISADEQPRMDFPPVPEGVDLRLRDVNTRLLLPPDPQQPAPPNNTKPAELRREQPVLLLRPEGDNWRTDDGHSARPGFNFSLQTPATDINTWDRWKANVEANRDLRNRVWAAYYYHSDIKTARPEGTVTPPENDVSIDDPAVSPYLFAELAELDGTAPAIHTWGRYPDPVPSADPIQTLSSIRRGRISVSCVVVANGFALVPTNGGATLTASLTKGRIYRLTFWVCVPYEDRGRFDRIFPFDPFPIRTPMPDNRQVIRVSPVTFFIETATDELLAIDEKQAEVDDRQLLYDALNPRFEQSGDDQISVQLMQASGPSEKSFRYIKRAELSRQIWRWQGRDTKPHPRTMSGVDENSEAYRNEVERWEEHEFGARDELDRVVAGMETVIERTSTGTLPVERPTGRRFFRYVEKLVEQSQGNPREPGTGASDFRALHFRFQVTLFSRYAELLRGCTSISSSNLRGTTGMDLQTCANQQVPKTRTIWKPLFVGCRHTKRPDPPKLKFILPLTESFGELQNGSAGALVVFDEQWHDVGGISETLLVQVAPYQDPSLPPGTPQNTNVFEAGPDPLIESVDRVLSAPADSATFEPVGSRKGVRGPIGHTFDRSSAAPFFTATSFIVPAPTTVRAPTGTTPGATPAYHVPWSFAKLSFARQIVCIRRDGSREELKSDFTKPFWVQFIPEFSLLSPASPKPSELRVRWVSTTRVSIVKSDDGTGVDLPPPPEGQMFERFLILTRRIQDVKGDTTHETFLAVYARDSRSGDWTLLPSRPPLTPGADAPTPRIASELSRLLRARIINVQRHRTADGIRFESVLWERIFAERVLDKDRLRIVSVSEPIESV